MPYDLGSLFSSVEDAMRDIGGPAEHGVECTRCTPTDPCPVAQTAAQRARLASAWIGSHASRLPATELLEMLNDGALPLPLRIRLAAARPEVSGRALHDVRLAEWISAAPLALRPALLAARAYAR